MIPPDETRIYFLFPADFLPEHRALFGGPIPGRVANSPEEIRDLYSKHVGENFRFRLPVQVGDAVYTYEFAMTVSEIYPYLARESF